MIKVRFYKKGLAPPENASTYIKSMENIGGQMTFFYKDEFDKKDVISTLTSNIEGKYGRRVKPYYEGRPFYEGVTLYMADKPEQAENEAISFLPSRNKDGSARLEIICCAVKPEGGTISVEEKVSCEREERANECELYEKTPC